MGDRLRPLWDFGDLDATEARLREALAAEQSDEGRAEVLTQLARAEGLRDRFAEGDALLDEAAALAPSSAIVVARVDLERGRLRRSGGDPVAALPLFERAFDGAMGIPHEFLAVDAAHMAAIAAPDVAAKQAWADRGIDMAEASSDPEVVGWLGPFYNNLGWDYYDEGDYATALDNFERALAEREKRPDQPRPIEIAREAVAEARAKLEESRDS